MGIEGRVIISCDRIQDLFRAILGLGYRIVGPTVRDGAIVYADLKDVHELPAGWTDSQEAGSYRLKRRDDAALFGYAVGPHSAKQFLLPPSLRLWRARSDESGTVALTEEDLPTEKLALIGVRSCELHVVAIQDTVMTRGPHIDPDYAARRSRMLLVAVNCMVAGGTCFCVSMGTGPRVDSGYDLALTELISGDRHEFLVEVGTEAGAAVIAGLPSQPATEPQVRAALQVTEATAASMGRVLDNEGIKELLYANLENSRWDEVASRCLACTNCTMVCPTCFCTTVEDSVDLAGSNAERVRKWDSCYTMDFSHLYGGSVRSSIKSRYRQWLTHKLASWFDQFGTSGCVGCGRCITWCPVGIDLTEEVAAIRAGDLRKAARGVSQPGE